MDYFRIPDNSSKCSTLFFYGGSKTDDRKMLISELITSTFI